MTIGGRGLSFSVSVFGFGRRRRDDDLLDLVHPFALFALFAFEDKPVLLADLGGDLGLDGAVQVDEKFERHQVLDDLEDLDPHSFRQVLDR